MKYRRLSKEQFEELHLEFINFLATQSITAEEWKKIKAEQPKVAEEEMDIFSDLVWEGVLGKVKYLENIAPQHLYLFQIKASTIALIGLKMNPLAFPFSQTQVQMQMQMDCALENILCLSQLPLDVK